MGNPSGVPSLADIIKEFPPAVSYLEISQAALSENSSRVPSEISPRVLLENSSGILSTVPPKVPRNAWIQFFPEMPWECYISFRIHSEISIFPISNVSGENLEGIPKEI